MLDFNPRLMLKTMLCYAALLCVTPTVLMSQNVVITNHDFPEVIEVVGEPVYESEVVEVVDANVCQQELLIKNPCHNRDERFIIREGDEVWFVDARALINGERDLERLKVFQFTDGQRTPRLLSELVEAHGNHTEGATVLYVHGNQTDEEYATLRGFQVYRNTLTNPTTPRVPVRFVIWAWRSEQEKVRLYPDFLIKSQRSITVGETFAATLNEFPDRNVVVLGYSLGVQVLLSAFDSPCLMRRTNDSTRYEAIFVAPAINPKFVADHSLMRNNQSQSIIKNSFVFTNRKDRAIRAAQSIIRRERPGEATTITGLAQAGGLDVGHLTEVDVSDEAGRLHNIRRYSMSEKLQRVVIQSVNRSAANRMQNCVSE